MADLRKKKATKVLKRQQTQKKAEVNIGTFDIETENIGFGSMRFIIGCAITEIGEYHFFDNAEHLLDFLLSSHGVRWYAHNGARFDFLYFVPFLLQRTAIYDIGTVQQADKIIGFTFDEKSDDEAPHKSNRTKKHDVEIRDSLPILPSSLEGVTQSFSPDLVKLKGDVDFKGGEQFDPQNEKHMNYLKRDCDGLLASLRKFYDLCYDLFNTSPGWTGGGTAVKSWRTMIPEGHTYGMLKQIEKEDFIRQAYYGGYVFPGTSTDEKTNITSVDVNAMYALGMAQGVPTGSGTPTGHYNEEKPGFYRVIATSPIDIERPILGRHTLTGVRWARGTFETHTTSIEIEYARSKGYTIEVLEGIYFDKIEYPFTEILERCQSLEETVDPSTGKVDPAKKSTAKLIRNSLYGKFGQKRTVQSIVLCAEMPDGAIPLVSEEGEIVDGLFKLEEENTADYLLPHWSGWITACARLELFRLCDAIAEGENDIICYTDTDSVKAPKEYIDRAIERGDIVIHKTKYGCAKNEGTFDTFQSLGCKVYHGNMGSHHEIKAKGTPQRAIAEMDECPLCLAAKGDYTPVQFTSMHSLLKTFKNPHELLYSPMARKVSSIVNSEGWNYEPTTGRISPITLNMYNKNGLQEKTLNCTSYDFKGYSTEILL